IFDGIFVSEEIGAPKPQLPYFEKCFQEIAGFQKDETLIVGDSLTSDMQGGNNAGIACCWYNPEKIENDTGLKIDYEIHNLWEVEEILCPNLPTRK
ncbi:MAG: HAD-IA family hydrolase, partial [Lachnospiraceae bacterium]|nr:HAD-IA family hydrolase [Lachnospiraceae bacterium]